MKSLLQILEPKLNTQGKETKETLKDNEYLLKSNVKKKRQYAIWNLNLHYHNDKKAGNPLITDAVDEFLSQL